MLNTKIFRLKNNFDPRPKMHYAKYRKTMQFNSKSFSYGHAILPKKSKQ